jgi:hypothetical protein
MKVKKLKRISFCKKVKKKKEKERKISFEEAHFINCMDCLLISLDLFLRIPL